jgi:hypothetical protein
VFRLDEDRGRLASAQRHRRFVDPHRDRVAAEQSLMQDLDPSAFDKPQFDQPPLELGGGEAVVAALDANRPNPSSRSDGSRTERHGLLRFTSSNAYALSDEGTSYCEWLSVASSPSHSWYRISCGMEAEDVPSDENRLRLHFREGGLTLAPSSQSAGSPLPTANYNLRLCEKSCVAVSAASLQQTLLEVADE